MAEPIAQQGPVASRTRGQSAPGRARVQSVARCLDILEALEQAQSSVSLAELSARVGLHPSTCHHLVATIASRGYIAQDAHTRRYALGPRVFALARERACPVDLPALARPYLERLHHHSGETAELAAIEGNDLVSLIRIEARAPERADAAHSLSHAAHATALGRAILAWLPEREFDAILAAHGLRRFTPRTVGSRVALIEALRLVRRFGFAEVREEFQAGVLGVAAVVQGPRAAAAGALGVSLSPARAGEAVIARIRRTVMTAAQALSRDLGAPPANEHDRHARGE